MASRIYHPRDPYPHEPGPRPERRASGPPDQFKDFHATQLYCSKCRQAMPTRERLLLILPDGALYEYRCARCGESVGTRQARGRL